MFSPARDALRPTRTEQVPGGTVVLFDYMSQCRSDCEGEGFPPGEFAARHARLLGVSQADSSSVVVKLDGGIAANHARLSARPTAGGS